MLHSGGTGTFGDEGGTTLNMGGHMYLCQNVRLAASLRIRSTDRSAASGFGPLTRRLFVQGQIWTNFIGVAYQLQDVTEEDGGFICIPGSHKYHPALSASCRRPCPTA